MGLWGWLLNHVWADETEHLTAAVERLHEEVMRLRRDNDRLRHADRTQRALIAVLRDCNQGLDERLVEAGS